MIIEFLDEWMHEFVDCKKESCFMKILASKLGGECKVKIGILEIDILIRCGEKDIAIEVKYLRNKRIFYEGIGQALAYRIVLGIPTILVQFYDEVDELTINALKEMTKCLPIDIVVGDFSKEKFITL